MFEIGKPFAHLIDTSCCFLHHPEHLDVQLRTMPNLKRNGIERMRCVIKQNALLPKLIVHDSLRTRIYDDERIGIVVNFVFDWQSSEQPDVVTGVKSYRSRFGLELLEVRLVEPACDLKLKPVSNCAIASLRGREGASPSCATVATFRGETLLRVSFRPCRLGGNLGNVNFFIYALSRRLAVRRSFPLCACRRVV